MGNDASEESEIDWSEYYDRVAGRDVRPLLSNTLGEPPPPTLSPERPMAIDLGSGDGTEAIFLLQHGYAVLAIDGSPAGIQRLTANCPPDLLPHLQTRVARFEGLTLPPSALIHTSFSIPFCAPAHFPALWDSIVASLEPGGRFIGVLFGINDTWASTESDMTFHSRQQVESLLQSFDIDLLNEEEVDGMAKSGPKHWHTFSIDARKR